jgi:hypothetical protein
MSSGFCDDRVASVVRWILSLFADLDLSLPDRSEFKNLLSSVASSWLANENELFLKPIASFRAWRRCRCCVGAMSNVT